MQFASKPNVTLANDSQGVDCQSICDNNFLVSIIIPCYNAEKYIAEALASIVDQFIFSTEIIIIDDGSKDHSVGIIKSIIRNNKSGCVIKLVSQDNRGPGAARNIGLDCAQGKYIGFLDADDVFLNGLSNALFPIITAGVPDIIEFGFRRFESGFRFDDNWRGLYNFSGLYNLEALLNEVFARTVWYPSIRIYRNDLWRNIRFPEGVYYEDPMTIYKTFLIADRIHYIDRPFLGYRINPESTTARHTTKQLEDLVGFYWSIEGHLECLDIFRVRLARTISYFAFELGMDDSAYVDLRLDMKRIKLGLRNLLKLGFPDIAYYVFPEYYDKLNKFRLRRRGKQIN